MRMIKKGATDQSVVIRIVDSTDGTPETGVEHNTSGIDLWYRREGAVKTSITEAALSALNDAHSDGGIEHIGDGYYRLDLPDAAVATGANGVMIGGAVTGMVVIGCYVPLVDFDPQDAVRLGLTALPNAAPDAAGGLPISDVGGLDLDAQIGTKINDILTDTGTTLQGELDGIQADTEDIQTRLPAALVGGRMDSNMQALADAVITAAKFNAGAFDAAALATDAVNEIRDAVFARAFSAAYGSYTFDELMKMCVAVLLGKASGMATTTGTFRNLADSADVIVATIDANGNRTAVTRTP